MVFHSDDEDGAALLINTAVSVLAGSVNFMDDFLFLADLVRAEALVPLNPLLPHFVDLLLLELPGDAEPGHCVDVRVEVAPVL